MIRCRIVQIDSEGEAGERQSTRAMHAEVLTLGRAAACKIYLPDPTVRLRHAQITGAEDGYLYLEGLGGNVAVDGVDHSSLKLATGQSFPIGTYTFKVLEIAHGPGCSQAVITLQVSQREAEAGAANRAEAAAKKSPTNLGVRSLSWLVVLLSSLFLLLLPLQQVQKAQAGKTPPPAMAMDAMWNPGTLSSAHQHLGNSCTTCHTQAFVRVQDTACASCHQRVGAHIAHDAALEKQAFGNQRCASCHREHQGVQSMKTTDAMGCVDCHRQPQQFVADTKTPAISDFAKDHPAFRLSVQTGKTANSVQRVLQDTKVQESSGLHFSHKVHLAEKGVKSPDGPIASNGRVVLSCGNCHHLDSAKVRYEPVRMERDCANCHRLGFDLQQPTKVVPHAAPDQVLEALQDLYAAAAVQQSPGTVLTVNAFLQAPQSTPATVQNTPTKQWISERTQAAAHALFAAPSGTCVLCHTVSTKPAANKPNSAPAAALWEIAPVFNSSHWLPGARFTHVGHADAPCETCHRANTSASSKDVLIPTIAVCKECHSGTEARWGVGSKVRSQCSDCHDFHSPMQHAAFMPQKPVITSPGATGTSR